MLTKVDWFTVDDYYHLYFTYAKHSPELQATDSFINQYLHFKSATDFEQFNYLVKFITIANHFEIILVFEPTTFEADAHCQVSGVATTD